MDQTSWNYPLNQQNLLVLCFNAWLMLTSKGQAAAGNVPVHGQSPRASPICWELGWDSRAVGLCGSRGCPGSSSAWGPGRVTLPAAPGKSLVNAKRCSPKCLECALVIMTQAFSAFSLKAFMDWLGLPKNYSPKPDYQKALIWSVQTFRFGLAMRNQS